MKTSEWIALTGRRYVNHNWFGDWCLQAHFWLPPEATEVQFVKGVKVEDALYLQGFKVADSTDKGMDYMMDVSGHYENQLNRPVGMLSDFIEWFGEKPGWLYVNWR